MIILTNAEKRTVTGRGLIIVTSAKSNRATPSDFQKGTIIRHLTNTYKVTSVEHTRNLFDGGIGDVVGLQVTPITYDTDTLFRIVYFKEDNSDMYTAFVKELPGIVVEGKTRGEARKRILAIMPTMMQDLDPLFTDQGLEVPVIEKPTPPMERIIREGRSTIQRPSPEQ